MVTVFIMIDDKNDNGPIPGEQQQQLVFESKSSDWLFR